MLSGFLSSPKNQYEEEDFIELEKENDNLLQENILLSHKLEITEHKLKQLNISDRSFYSWKKVTSTKRWYRNLFIRIKEITSKFNSVNLIEK